MEKGWGKYIFATAVQMGMREELTNAIEGIEAKRGEEGRGWEKKREEILEDLIVQSKREDELERKSATQKKKKRNEKSRKKGKK